MNSNSLSRHPKIYDRLPGKTDGVLPGMPAFASGQPPPIAACVHAPAFTFGTMVSTTCEEH